MDIKGTCIGVRLEPRGEKDRHILVTLLVEDDEVWNEGTSVSSHWIDEMIDVLTKARDHMKKNEAADICGSPKRQYGYKFKKRSAGRWRRPEKD